MQYIEYTITDENGIHARPAGRIVNTAKAFESGIRIILADKEKSADAKKLFEVMGMGIRKGDTVRIEAEGSDAQTALEAIRKTMTEAGL